MQIYLLDFDSVPIKASCDKKKLEDEAKEKNGGENYPYFVTSMVLEDIPQHKCAWCKSLGRETTLIKHPVGRGYVCPYQGCFYDDKNIVFDLEGK